MAIPASQPFFRYHVFCCVNERPMGHERGCCKDKGAVKIRDYLKARVKELGLPDIRINQAGCLDQCELGPCVVIYPDGVWYRIPTIEAAEEIVHQHLLSGKVIDSLLLSKA
jgi:(2Fe-2S) ferredoxin